MVFATPISNKNATAAVGCHLPNGIITNAANQTKSACRSKCYNFYSSGPWLETRFPQRVGHRRGVAQPGRAPGSGPGGRRFKSSLPDQLFSRFFNRLRCLLPVSLFDEFRYIRYNRRQFKADATLLSPLSAEGNVLFDFVVEVAYVLSRMTHPVLVKIFGAVGIVPQVRFSEATESMVSRLVCSGVRVDVVHSGAPRSCNRIVLLLGRGPWVAGNNRAYPKGVHLTTSSGRS